MYTQTHIKPPLYFTKCALSTCKREEVKERRNFGHPRGLVVAGLECRAFTPFSLIYLGKHQLTSSPNKATRYFRL